MYKKNDTYLYSFVGRETKINFVFSYDAPVGSLIATLRTLVATLRSTENPTSPLQKKYSRKKPYKRKYAGLTIFIAKMEMVGWTSLYIPHLDEIYTVDELTYMFETKYAIGKIKRIDIPRAKEPREPNATTDAPTNEGVKTPTKGYNPVVPPKNAFVHFETWYWNDFTVMLRAQLEETGKYNLNAYPDFLRAKLSEQPDCKPCRIMYERKLSEILDEPDELVLLIHRAKYMHTHIPPPDNDALFSKFSVLRSESTDKSSKYGDKSSKSGEVRLVGKSDEHKTSEFICNTIEQHEKRIELLEDQIDTILRKY